MSIIEDLSFYGIGKITRKYLNKKDDISLCRDWLKEVISEPIVFNFISDELALEMFEEFKRVLEEKIEKLIFENVGEKKIPIGTTVKAKTSFGENFKIGDIATITEVTRFEEDTFNQGWYIYRLNNGISAYGFEIEVV